MELTAYPRTPRLINRFSLGADPEFVFHTKAGEYVHAEALGLTTMQGFGCDMAGRQAEIRAYPSRFALEVVAGIMDSLRWLAYAKGQYALDYEWLAPAHNGTDGCGGHVHFGRRRPTQRQDTVALDRTTNILLDTGVFDRKDFNNRVVRSKYHYGAFGDIRPQSHGFEYRTFPTELASPWLTYLVLVVSKLAVFADWPVSVTAEVPSPDRILQLLKLYEDRDDDAAIALRAFQVRGLPSNKTLADIKPMWGIPGLQPMIAKYVTYFPSTIAPEDRTCQELFLYLTEGKMLPSRVPNPTWNPAVLPKGFQSVTVQVHTMGHLPDVGMDLVSKGLPVTVLVGSDFNVYTSVQLPVKKIKQAVSDMVERANFYTGDTDGIQIVVPREFCKSLLQCKKLHRILSDSDLFPVCKAKNIDKVDWLKWADSQSVKEKTKLGRVIGVVIRPEPRLAPVPKQAVVQQQGYQQYAWAPAQQVAQPQPVRRQRAIHFEEDGGDF